MAKVAGVDPKHLPEIAAKKEELTDVVLQYIQQLSAKKADKLVNTIHINVFSQIDCLQCANCCKTTSPLFNQEDIGRISLHLSMSRADFVQQYLEMDEDGDFVFNRPAPCPFLGTDNSCSVYEVRPKACREYPHTGEPGQRKILSITKQNVGICPGVYEIISEISTIMD